MLQPTPVEGRVVGCTTLTTVGAEEEEAGRVLVQPPEPTELRVVEVRWDVIVHCGCSSSCYTTTFPVFFCFFFRG